MKRAVKNIVAAATITAAAMVMTAFATPVSAQNVQVGAGGAENGQESNTKQTDHRYALVKSNGDILRIDREAGSVSFCRKTNGTWRCMPAPLAEDAYLAEIAALSEEVDRLKSELANLQPDMAPSGAAPDQPSPSANSDAPQSTAKDPEVAAKPEPKEAPEPEKPSTRLSEEDEQQLEKMLRFSENAMRRFFGLMRDIQSELEGG